MYILMVHFSDVNTIDFSAQWNDIYDDNETLVLYIGLIDKLLLE